MAAGKENGLLFGAPLVLQVAIRGWKPTRDILLEVYLLHWIRI